MPHAEQFRHGSEHQAGEGDKFPHRLLPGAGERSGPRLLGEAEDNQSPFSSKPQRDEDKWPVGCLNLSHFGHCFLWTPEAEKGPVPGVPAPLQCARGTRAAHRAPSTAGRRGAGTRTGRKAGGAFCKVFFAASPFGAVSFSWLRTRTFPSLGTASGRTKQQQLRIRTRGRTLILSFCRSAWTEQPSETTAGLLSKPERNSPAATINTAEQRAVNLKRVKGNIFERYSAVGLLHRMLSQPRAHKAGAERSKAQPCPEPCSCFSHQNHAPLPELQIKPRCPHANHLSQPPHRVPWSLPWLDGDGASRPGARPRCPEDAAPPARPQGRRSRAGTREENTKFGAPMGEGKGLGAALRRLLLSKLTHGEVFKLTPFLSMFLVGF